jgi:hypothetical protein
MTIHRHLYYLSRIFIYQCDQQQLICTFRVHGFMLCTGSLLFHEHQLYIYEIKIVFTLEIEKIQMAVVETLHEIPMNKKQYINCSNENTI